MKEKGFIIDKDGNITSFGIYGSSETLESMHEKSFINEVVDTPYFQSLDLEYDESKTLYNNAEILSQKGIIFIFNKQLNIYCPTQILSYMPKNPTRKQLEVLKQKQLILDEIEIKNIYELNSNEYSDAKEYNEFQDYISEKDKLVEHGIVIFPNGNSLSFGNYTYPSDPNYQSSSTHERSFTNEILTSTEFKNSDFIYYDDNDLYTNIIRLSLEGLITVLNKQESAQSPTQIISFMPENPTEEQISYLRENKILSNIEIQKVCEFQSESFSDYIKHDSLNDYINNKSKSKR